MFPPTLKAQFPILSNELKTPRTWEYKKQSCVIRPAREGDGFSIGSKLRKADLIEVMAHSTENPCKLLEDSVNMPGANTYTIDMKGLPIAMFGVVPYQENIGVIWLLGTDDIVKVKIPFLRNCRFWLDAFSGLYPVLFNVVSKENKLHITWLKWMGFEFTKEHPEYGLNKEPFIEFVKVKK